MATPKISMSIFMLKTTGLSKVEELLAEHGPVPLMNGLTGQFITFPSEAREPAWFGAVREHLGTQAVFDIKGQAPAGMILLAQAAKHFVITFGHAWQYLELSWLEPDYGRQVALGTIPPDKVVEVNSEQVFAKFHVAKERAPRATSYYEFGVEAHRDLVGALEGKPADNVFGSLIRGSISLRVSVPLRTVGALLDKSIIYFSSTSYRRRYRDIDNLMVIKDPNEIADLDRALDNDIQSGKAKSDATLFAPAFRRGDANHADRFVVGSLAGNPAFTPYLTYGAWETNLQRRQLSASLALAKSTPVHMFDEAGESFDKRSVYDCLGYEVAKTGTQYILSSGIWYSAETKFVQNIQDSLDAIPKPPCVLPRWNQSDNEAKYNLSCCSKASGRLHFDKRIIHFGGKQSKFEFCDFMDPNKNILFFAKIPGQSSDCSHLVEQVSRTVELLFSSDGGFRTKLKQAIVKHYSNISVAWLNKRPRSGDWKLCLVAMGKEKDDLPLFAKCSIARLRKTLDMLGHSLMYIAV